MNENYCILHNYTGMDFCPGCHPELAEIKCIGNPEAAIEKIAKKLEESGYTLGNVVKNYKKDRKNIDVRRVIGRKECIRCGYPVVVEGYKVDQVLKMLKGYKKCKKPINWTQACEYDKFTEPKVEIIAVKGGK